MKIVNIYTPAACRCLKRLYAFEYAIGDHGYKVVVHTVPDGHLVPRSHVFDDETGEIITDTPF